MNSFNRREKHGRNLSADGEKFDKNSVHGGVGFDGD